MSSSNALVLSDFFGSDGQYAIDNDGVASKTFPNGKVLSLRSVLPRGYVLHLSDDNHRLQPVAHFMHTVDEEDRMSVKIGLRLRKMPSTSGWGKVRDSLELRTYEPRRPFWRAGEPDDGSADRYARDKVVLHGNLVACLPKDQREGLSEWISFEFRGDMHGKVQIPDELWNPVQDFALAAAQGMKDGEFPDFSLLNTHGFRNKRDKPVAFAALDDVLAYDGPLKDCE